MSELLDNLKVHLESLKGSVVTDNDLNTAINLVKSIKVLGEEVNRETDNLLALVKISVGGV